MVAQPPSLTVRAVLDGLRRPLPGVQLISKVSTALSSKSSYNTSTSAFTLQRRSQTPVHDTTSGLFRRLAVGTIFRGLGRS